MVDTPYGDCFAVLTKWVFEPHPAASSASSSSAAATAIAAAAASSDSSGDGGGSSSSGGNAGASGGCSVSVSAELVRSKHTRALWLHLPWLSLPQLDTHRGYTD
mgnify:FL=1